jgi:hypothetical protein
MAIRMDESEMHHNLPEAVCRGLLHNLNSDLKFMGKTGSTQPNIFYLSVQFGMLILQHLHVALFVQESCSIAIRLQVRGSSG